jgi:lipopolysaccharide export system protein LptA
VGNPLARGDSAIKKLDCKGPVTIATKTQVATGDNAEFDRTKNKVFLTGNAALSDGPNVTRGERVAYDLNTGVANVEGGRVRALIVPGSQKPAAATPGAKTR